MCVCVCVVCVHVCVVCVRVCEWVRVCIDVYGSVYTNEPTFKIQGACSCRVLTDLDSLVPRSTASPCSVSPEGLILQRIALVVPPSMFTLHRTLPSRGSCTWGQDGWYKVDTALIS